jgi:TrmH family RNA methyltransferase
MIARDVTSLQHPIVKHLVKLRDNRNYRSETRTALVSGIKLISELSLTRSFRTLLLTKGFTPPRPLQAEQTFIVTPEIMKKVTGLREPEPLAAEIALPSPADLSDCHLLLILDRINDPGNLGNLLRTALAMNWEAVFLTPGSADPFNEKALRAAKGATFKIKIREGSYEELQQLVRQNGLHLFIADARGKALPSTPPQGPKALVLGNEAQGASPHFNSEGVALSIPMNRDMESLNVATAGAILMFYLQGGCDGKRG